MIHIDIGMQVARAEFKRRGNHAEAHLSEAELAALISIGAERAQELAQARIVEIQAQLQTAQEELRERVENEVERAYGLEGSAAPVRKLVEALRWSHAMLRTLMDAVPPAARSSFLAGLANNKAALEKLGAQS